jgi:diadenosine tetraphosphate (Ap4A) HIT family hydrolase
MRSLFISTLLMLTLCMAASADITGCACDPSNPESMRARECSLCNEAEKQDPETRIFFLKDINPRKANRWLALPRVHKHTLQEMTKAERTELWKAAIQKAQKLWGNDWGLAFNGHRVRTQCHAHIHIGKFLTATENDHNVITVSGPEHIPVPDDDSGLWVHPAGKDKKKLHVHRGDQICETTLLR